MQSGEGENVVLNTAKRLYLCVCVSVSFTNYAMHFFLVFFCIILLFAHILRSCSTTRICLENFSFSEWTNGVRWMYNVYAVHNAHANRWCGDVLVVFKNNELNEIEQNEIIKSMHWCHMPHVSTNPFNQIDYVFSAEIFWFNINRNQKKKIKK